MKDLYSLSKKLKFKFVALALCSTFALVSSCKDDEIDPFEDATIQFKVESTQGVVLKAVVTQVGVEQNQNFVFPSNNYNTVAQVVSTSVGALHIATTATGLDADSEVIVKIFVNGKAAAVDTAKGAGPLTAKTQFNFLE